MPFWSPDELVTTVWDSTTTSERFPLRKGRYEFNLFNSSNLGYEAEHVRDCLVKGLRESPVVTHAHTAAAAEIAEEVRRQAGVVYEQDGE